MTYYQDPNDVYRQLNRVTMESQKKDELIMELEKERDYLRVYFVFLSYQNRSAEFEKQLNEAKTTIYQYEGKINSINSNSIPYDKHVSYVNEQIGTRQKQLEQIIRDKDRVENQYSTTQNQLELLTSQVQALQADNNQLRKVLSKESQAHDSALESITRENRRNVTQLQQLESERRNLSEEIVQLKLTIERQLNVFIFFLLI